MRTLERIILWTLVAYCVIIGFGYRYAIEWGTEFYITYGDHAKTHHPLDLPHPRDF